MQPVCPRCGLFHAEGSPCHAMVLPKLPATELAPGTLLAGRYLISQVLYRGGMSVVYLAEDRMQHQERIALKELRFAEDSTPDEQREAEAWFARESFLLSSLRHPLIPMFYGVFREHDHAYIALDYIHGETLEALVTQAGPVDPVQAISWGITLCDLLTYLHEQPDGPLIYRDLKPANILLRYLDHQLTVVDFGIARYIARGQVGTVIGTPGYAPPEQYQGIATPESDVYALGTTLHRLLTGYDAEHAQPFRQPDPCTLNPRLPKRLATVVMRALQLEPSARYPSARAMRNALAEAQRQLDPVARHRRRRLTYVAMLAALLTVLVAGTVNHFQAGSSRLAEPVAPTSTLPPMTPTHAPTPTATPIVLHGTVKVLADDGEDIALGPDGNLWFTTNTGGLKRITPRGVITSFPTPIFAGSPLRDLIVGADGTVWMISAYYGVQRMARDGSFTNYPLSNYAGGSPKIEYSGIALGADGNVWLIENSLAGSDFDRTSNVIRLTPTGKVTRFFIPCMDCAPSRIIAGPDGNLWLPELHWDFIGRFTPQGAFTQYVSGLAFDSAEGLMSGPDDALWFMSTIRNPDGSIVPELGRMSVQGAVSDFPLSQLPVNLNRWTMDAAGYLWAITDDARIVRLDTRLLQPGQPAPTKAMVSYSLRFGHYQQPLNPNKLIIGPHGSLWCIGNGPLGAVTPPKSKQDPPNYLHPVGTAKPAGKPR